MSSTVKNGKWHFGMKAHIGVDSKFGFVHSLGASTAKTHDTRQFEEFLHGEEQAVLVIKITLTPLGNDPSVKRVFFVESLTKRVVIPPCLLLKKRETVNYLQHEQLLNIRFRSSSVNGTTAKHVIAKSPKTRVSYNC